ncbi:hypothetical protein ID866_6185 [Astraeus odoratus]|nr:hypothetical protein ID866_6185 [Astraeus odoratus]
MRAFPNLSLSPRQLIYPFPTVPTLHFMHFVVKWHGCRGLGSISWT